jgi:hypothetical protein
MPRLIEVRYHAISQFRERFPSKLEREALRQLIAHEVESALEEGRYASREPKWSRDKRTRGKRNDNELDRTLRFCWTEDEDRLYLVDKIGTTVRVITSIKPSGDGDTLTP